MINHHAFPGSDWTTEQCDALAVQFVPLNLLQEEADLFQTKFWDYRFLHPTQATQLFAHSYAQAKKHAVERRTDIWVGRNMKGIKAECIFELPQRTITGFWKGRQMADRLGIPYDFYCEYAMLFADVARWENLPTATQLYSDSIPVHLRQTDYAVSMVTYIGRAWIDRSETFNGYATHPAYLAENFVNGPDQIHYLNALSDAIKHSGFPAAVLASLLEKGQMNRELITTIFPASGESLYNRAAALNE